MQSIVGFDLRHLPGLMACTVSFYVAVAAADEAAADDVAL